MKIEMSLKEISVMWVGLEEVLRRDLIGGIEFKEVAEKLNEKLVKIIEEMEIK